MAEDDELYYNPCKDILYLKFKGLKHWDFVKLGISIHIFDDEEHLGRTRQNWKGWKNRAVTVGEAKQIQKLYPGLSFLPPELQ